MRRSCRVGWEQTGRGRIYLCDVEGARVATIVAAENLRGYVWSVDRNELLERCLITHVSASFDLLLTIGLLSS